MSANPVLVEVTRGPVVESRHRVAVAVVDAKGKTLKAKGDIGQGVMPRSAVKPLQALLLVESGAAEAFNCPDKEVALACASHEGEPIHVESVEAWLARIGLSVADLECGPHMPYWEPSIAELYRTGRQPTAAHNNCSGKHSGFLTAARHMGVPTKGYVGYDHPVQQGLRRIMGEMMDLDLDRAPWGYDGCSIPTLAIPLDRIALGMARFADPSSQSDERRTACRRILGAVARHPVMIAGTTRFCTKVIEVTGERALIKTGAEGVYCAALPTLGLGVALKVDDGAGRAAEVAMGEILVELGILTEGERQRLNPILHPVLTNRREREVGTVRATQPLF